MYIATGNTYKAKDDLKKIGFTWNKEQKRWESENPNLQDWVNKYISPAWNGRGNAKNNADANITFEKI